MERHEYSILVPREYDPKTTRIPLVVSLHGRVIDPRHPALRYGFGERSRVVIWNSWLKTPAAEEALVIAPTAVPNGFTFSDEDHYKQLRTLYRTLAEALTKYRVDWSRIFLEVHGEAIRIVCEQTFMFAGFIVRDRIDNRREPLVGKEQSFMLENLNGVPLCYVADEANWDKVGKPTSEALQKAYQKAGAQGNLVILKTKRDVNDALRGDEKKIKEFITTHRRPAVRKSFKWRFFRLTMANPMPFELDANVYYDVSQQAKDAPLAEKAGSMNVEVRQETVKDEEGREHAVNLVNVNVTEAQAFVLYLPAGLINFDRPLSVKVNGDLIIDRQAVEYDWEMFWANIVPRRFFMLPFLGSVEAKFDLRVDLDSGKGGVGASLGSDGLTLSDKDDKARVSLGMEADGTFSLRLFDKDGKLIWKAP
jgi:hypothetical protein